MANQKCMEVLWSSFPQAAASDICSTLQHQGEPWLSKLIFMSPASCPVIVNVKWTIHSGGSSSFSMDNKEALRPFRHFGSRDQAWNLQPLYPWALWHIPSHLPYLPSFLLSGLSSILLLTYTEHILCKMPCTKLWYSWFRREVVRWLLTGKNTEWISKLLSHPCFSPTIIY